MTNLLPSIVALTLLGSACSENLAGPTPPLPTPLPSVVAPPQPSSRFSEVFTDLTIGERAFRRAGANSPECFGLPGWQCQFFRVTPTRDGALDLTLTWDLETQPGQPLDLSLFDPDGREMWSDYGPGPRGHMRARVKAGSTYQITVWYTFVGVEFELQSSLESE